MKHFLLILSVRKRHQNKVRLEDSLRCYPYVDQVMHDFIRSWWFTTCKKGWLYYRSSSTSVLTLSRAKWCSRSSFCLVSLLRHNFLQLFEIVGIAKHVLRFDFLSKALTVECYDCWHDKAKCLDLLSRPASNSSGALSNSARFGSGGDDLGCRAQ